MIPGIDVAGLYEPVIDWHRVQMGGYKFAFIKCSQATYNDPGFTELWKNAKSEGIPRGAYHFYSTIYQTDKPAAQAEYFFESLKGDLGELPFVIDLEKYTSGPYYGSRYWYDYLERLNYLSGNHPSIIYTSPSYWNENAYKSPSVVDISYFKKYDLWIANYGVTTPSIPNPWTTWKFWQYGEQLVQGVYDTLGRLTECDVDQFNGTEDDFKKYLLGQPTGEPMADYVELTPSVAGEYRSIRQQTSYPQTPHILGSRIGQINVGSSARALPTDFYVYANDVVVNGVVQANEGDKWWKIYSANGQDTVGWVAEIHKRVKYLDTMLVTTTPPPNPSHVVEVFIDGVLEFRKELL